MARSARRRLVARNPHHRRNDLERRLNVFPILTTEIDGQRFHLVHARSKEPDPVPLLIVHGYPSSFVEFLPLVDLLHPEFDVVVPSLLGFGYSTSSSGSGWGLPCLDPDGTAFWSEHAHGGHFPALTLPRALAADLRLFLR